MSTRLDIALAGEIASYQRCLEAMRAAGIEPKPLSLDDVPEVFGLSARERLRHQAAVASLRRDNAAETHDAWRDTA